MTHNAYLIEQRLDLLLSLPFADLVGISNFEELRSNLHKPFRLDCCNVVAIFAVICVSMGNVGREPNVTYRVVRISSW
jgi:hypothetical protein